MFIVLVEGIFVEYKAHDAKLDNAAILTITQQLKERWSDSARAYILAAQLGEPTAWKEVDELFRM